MNLTDQSALRPVRRGERASPLFVAGLAVVIFVATWACVALIERSGRISTIWISNAILLAALLRHSRRAWPELMAVAFIAYAAAGLVAGDNVYVALGLNSGNCLEVLLLAIPLRWLGYDRIFSRSDVLLIFYVMASRPVRPRRSMPASSCTRSPAIRSGRRRLNGSAPTRSA